MPFPLPLNIFDYKQRTHGICYSSTQHVHHTKLIPNLAHLHSRASISQVYKSKQGNFSFPDLEFVYSRRSGGRQHRSYRAEDGTRRRSDGEPKARERGGFGAVMVSCCRMGRRRMGKPGTGAGRSGRRRSGARRGREGAGAAGRRGVGAWPSTGRRTRAKAGERPTGTGREEEERGTRGSRQGYPREGCVRGAGVFE